MGESRLSRAARSFLDFRYLVVSFSILFAVIIILAFFLVYQNAQLMHEQINLDFNQQQLILSRQAASQIGGILSDMATELDTLKKLRINNPEASLEQAMKALVERTSRKGLIEVGLLSADGRIVQAINGGGTESAKEETILAHCRLDDARMRLGPLHVEEEHHSVVTAMLCTRIDDIGGIVFARIDVSRLVSGVTSEIRSGKTGYAWVIDETGLFLYHPEKEFVGKNAFTARKERKPYISFTQINKIMQERMLRGEEGTGTYMSGWHRGIEGELEKLIAFRAIDSDIISAEHMWSVAVVAPISEVAETVHNVYVRHIVAEAALIVGLFLFGLMAALYQHRLSQTLQEKVKQTEADLHETERIYKRIVEQATDLIYILDLEMRIVLLNRHAIETFSNLVITESEGGELSDESDLQAPETYIGKRLDQLFGTSDVQFMKRQMNKVLEGKASLSYEHAIRVRGRKYQLSTKLIPIRDDKKEIRYLLGISRDLTDKMEMEQRIYNTEKLASIGTLAAGVAHEINNPLGVILGFTDLLSEHFAEGSPEKEDLDIIEYNANHAKKVVENLLGFARITEGLEQTVDVIQSINIVTSIAKNTLMTKKIDLSTELPEDLPRVRGDSREFQQVIFNLINNAVAAMADQGGRLEIKAWSDQGWVNVSVHDTGMGIPDKIKPRIFDPFFTTKNVGEGTGLGLSLCYGIVKKYGGRIMFASVSKEDCPEIESHTTFTVSMPVPDGSEDEEEKI